LRDGTTDPVSDGKERQEMRRRLAMAVCAAMVLSGAAFAADAPVLKNDREKFSYSIGMDIGGNLKQGSVDVDPDLLAKGLKDSYGGKKTILTEVEARKTIQDFQQTLTAKRAETMQKVAEKNKSAGKKFLAENAGKTGVKTLPSGLQYRELRAGTGKTPKATDTVTVNYRGTLIEGKEFDSSYKRGTPATFPVSGVIAGWTEALQLMREGAKWQLFIPSNLAYGERGAGGDIGPNATLIFEVELISVK
jgi:FKBP-type peptidyl-prolyl cis-trans isomerase FklB